MDTKIIDIDFIFDIFHPVSDVVEYDYEFLSVEADGSCEVVNEKSNGYFINFDIKSFTFKKCVEVMNLISDSIEMTTSMYPRFKCICKV